MRSLFGDALPQVERFAVLLERESATRGLLGPREMDRLWDRHLVNCGALAPFLPADGLVVDVGSGAGLPGLVLGTMRPDLRFELVDSMRRRTEWMEEAAQAMGLENTTVTWSRAEDLSGRDAAAVVSRAVAGLDKLAAWTAHLLAPGGLFLALKGRNAEDELARCGDVMERHGLVGGVVLEAPVGGDVQAARLVRAKKAEDGG